MLEEPIELSTSPCSEKVVHLMEAREHWAIEAAVAANRPLLVQGEPGVGKTQLAMAAAKKLGRPLVTFTVDSRTESRDLLWTFDAVQRLAEAQVVSSIYRKKEDLPKLEARIDVGHFVHPGPLWWAINWGSAMKKLRPGQQPPGSLDDMKPDAGVVILIDEIDKGDRDLPNGLLEVFGARQFTPQGSTEVVRSEPGTPAPLIIVTTNGERSLPPAFVRRCLSLELRLPSVLGSRGEELNKEELDKFVAHLTKRGRLHFPDAPQDRLEKAARQIMSYRQSAYRNQQVQKPGQSEFLDLLRTVHNLADKYDADEVFKNVCELFRKSPEQLS